MGKVYLAEHFVRQVVSQEALGHVHAGEVFFEKLIVGVVDLL